MKYDTGAEKADECSIQCEVEPRPTRQDLWEAFAKANAAFVHFMANPDSISALRDLRTARNKLDITLFYVTEYQPECL
jgi:hypothetical protein